MPYASDFGFSIDGQLPGPSAPRAELNGAFFRGHCTVKIGSKVVGRLERNVARGGSFGKLGTYIYRAVNIQGEVIATSVAVGDALAAFDALALADAVVEEAPGDEATSPAGWRAPEAAPSAADVAAYDAQQAKAQPVEHLGLVRDDRTDADLAEFVQVWAEMWPDNALRGAVLEMCRRLREGR